MNFFLKFISPNHQNPLFLFILLTTSFKMPKLDDISYSREECIAAVGSYYDFLSQMYLPKTAILEPPEGSWPNITTEIMRGLGKTDEVISLLQQLPYIREPSDDNDKAHGAANCCFADWQFNGSLIHRGRSSGEACKMFSEGVEICDDVPAHVIGLALGEETNPIFLLDTNLGIVHWPECPDEIKNGPSGHKQIEDDAYDYAPENEADWRANAPAWAVGDFFEMLKDQFRELRFIPTSPLAVLDVYNKTGPDHDNMVEMLQDIYYRHGWPDLENFRKQDCLEAIKTALDEHYPSVGSIRW